MREQPATMAGALIQAEALQAAAEEPHVLLRAFRQHSDGVDWGSALAGPILRIARAAA